MKIYEHNETKCKYTLEILHMSMPFLDGNSRLGVYAFPYYWEGKVIFFKSTDFKEQEDWIKENFTVIAYT